MIENAEQLAKALRGLVDSAGGEELAPFDNVDSVTKLMGASFHVLTDTKNKAKKVFRVNVTEA